MRPLINLLSLIFMSITLIIGCEDTFEDIHRYSTTQSKEYPIYLDMSEIGNIQVKEAISLESPFKVLSNDNYYFVGDMIKGIHVYEKNAEGASYLCFIECRYIKDFELVNNLLYCNNLVDLVVLDVSNPLQTTVLHRQENYFNRFENTYWNVPYVEGKGIYFEKETHELTGVVTNKQPNLDFSELDTLYDNLTTKVIPDSWFSNHPEYDKPRIGIITIGTDEVYSYGSHSFSWAICSFNSGIFSEREEDIHKRPIVVYTPPYYYSGGAYPVRMYIEDSCVFVLGASGFENRLYCDCMLYNESHFDNYHLYYPDLKFVDVTYLPTMEVFFILSGQSIWGGFKNGGSMYMGRYLDYNVPTDATSILTSENNVITLGNELTVYLPSEDELTLVKEYPDISGTCYLKEGDILAVANTQGLFLYDISNLENIQLIQ